MINSRLFQLMSSLSKKELKGCQTYLQCTYPNKDETILFNHLKNNLKNPKSDLLTKECIRSTLFKEKGEKRIDNLTGLTVQLIEEFLCIQKLKSEDKKLTRLNLLSEIYDEKGLSNRRNSVTKKEEEVLDKSTKGQIDYWHLTNLYQTRYYRSNPEDYKKSDFKDLLDADRNIRILSTLSRLIYRCELLSRKNIASEDIDVIQVMVDKDIASEIPIKLYLLFEKLLSDKNDKNLDNAEQFLFENTENLYIEDTKKCFTHLINVYANYLRNNKLEYVPIALRVFKKGIEMGIVLDKDNITSVRFTNIVNLACQQQDFDWVQTFIKDFQIYLNKSEKRETVLLAKANLLFSKENYDETIKLLNEGKCKNMGNEAKKRAILLAATIEVHGDSRHTSDSINALYAFVLSKKKLHPTIKEGLQNYISILKKLIRQKHSKEKIIKELNNAKHIYLRSWLELKIKTYKQRF